MPPFPTRRPLLLLSPHPRLSALAFLAVLCLQSTACAPDELEREPELGLSAAELRECENGSPETLACGLNGRGTQSRTCVAGAWSSYDACVDPDVCPDGEVQQSACGILGTHSRQCTTGQWSDYGTCSAPESISLQVAGRKDMVHDAKRNLLYITTGGSAGEVRVYNLLTRQFEPSLLTGGSFSGIDLSPNGDQLIVADLLTNANNQNWVHHVDLTTGTAQRIFFTRAFYEAGTFTAVFTSDTEAPITSQFNGSGWVPMRKLALTTGTAQSIATVNQGTMLTLSADGSTVAYAESNISSGEWGRYKLGTQTFAEGATNWFVYEIAVSRQATQYAIPTYGGLFIYDGAMPHQATLGTYASQLPIGAVYSPVADELYLAWYGANTSIDVYSATTLQKLRDIAPTPGLFSWTGNHAFGNGRMRISRDGSLLFATTGSSGLVVHLTGR